MAKSTIFTERVPDTEVRDGLVFITVGGDDHPIVTAPMHVVKTFCEVTIRRIENWNDVHAGRVVPLKTRGAGH